MKHLIDAQSLIWYVDQDHLLSSIAHAVITNAANDLLLSAATIWEIGIKVGLNKLSLSLPYRAWMNKAVADLSLIGLPITIEYTDVQAGLPHHHRDPFDRMLVARAIVEQVSIISADTVFDLYGVSRVW